jgi:hypothetical protein
MKPPTDLRINEQQTILDLLAQQLPAALVNNYLMIKASAKL